MPESYVTNTLVEKLVRQFLCGKEEMSYESLLMCTTRHRRFATHSGVGSGFFGFVSTVHSHFWRIGKRVFNIAFAVFIREQKYLCHRKLAAENLLVWTRLKGDLTSCITF